ncbi:NHLP family bacteriocin export ABC transporter peptidase/permease/ATPase subunit [Desulfobacter vibrioformis]|uniref:NHLP family bacteriocin export ABC transporter peptidase/permease/ATPase subunit n=1 Tax=Desulfobacter vibrioformis TaxID=34031 RepID=UPI00068AA30D|nr:NHLP family bacteriocin export ABC transporter peptidase/permease/ATPase subunit [Desulfobacter vibrioformis]
MKKNKPAILWHRKRVRTPTVIQMEALECGAACLGIVLGYFGRFVPLEKLREECGVSRDGSKAVNILKAARKYGMVAKGFRKEPKGLETLALPMILFWNFNHFIVLEGMKGKKVFINDPAAGPKTISLEELDKSFTGVVLSLEPGPQFSKGGNKPGMLRALKGRLGYVKQGVAFAVLAGLGLVVPGFIIPTFSKVFVDDILVAQKTYWFKPMLLGMGVCLVLQIVLNWLKETALLRQQIKLAVATSSQFFHHVLRLPIAFFNQRYAGEISTRVQLNDRVAVLLSGDMATAGLSLINMVFYVVLMAYYDITLTGIGVSVAGLNFLFLSWVSRKRSDLNQRVLQERGKLMGTAMNGISLIESIKATGSESDFFNRWAGYQAKAFNAHQALLWWTNLLTPVPVLLSSINTAAILGVGALRVMDGGMTMGTLVAFQSLMNCFMAPVQQMVTLGGQFQEAVGDMNRLDDVMSYAQDSQYQQADSQALQDKNQVKLTGELTIKDLTFGYSPLEPPLIENFNLRVTPGARVAIVGTSGSGKSTIAKIICGLYQPWQGDVLFDGSPRHNIPKAVMLNSLSYVDQDIFLFSGSVRENLNMWNTALANADIVRAAKDAAIHEDISVRAGAYDGEVAEGGQNFSGGQRQRLEIAKALVTNPSVLILDEATSALDPETEKKIDIALRRRGCTCLIVAHRLSTIRDCDEIIVLDQGKVIQRGIHNELKLQDGPYRRLIEN